MLNFMQRIWKNSDCFQQFTCCICNNINTNIPKIFFLIFQAVNFVFDALCVSNIFVVVLTPNVGGGETFRADFDIKPYNLSFDQIIKTNP